MHNLPHGFDIYLVDIKTMKKIAQIFVAFSEKQNFTIPCPLQYCSNPPHIFRHSYGLVVVFEDNVEIGIVLLNRKKRYKF